MNYDDFWKNVLKEDEWIDELMRHESANNKEPLDSQRNLLNGDDHGSIQEQ
jgi:hypothetical protein